MQRKKIHLKQNLVIYSLSFTMIWKQKKKMDEMSGMQKLEFIMVEVIQFIHFQLM